MIHFQYSVCWIECLKKGGRFVPIVGKKIVIRLFLNVKRKMRELFECINEYPFISLCLATWICIIVGIFFDKD